ncbi:MAG TPA: LptF/LptG family permease [Planctomycetaceae bacterium]|nr:LptF/LptG family permease [Planctomycetaceae bacterium]
MRLLERYIFSQLVRVFAMMLIVITCLLVFVGAFGQMRESGLSAAQAVQILPYIVPSILPFTIPATLLLTVCVVYGRMAGDREIIAAKAAGIPIFTLMWPSLFLGAMLSVVSLLLLDQVIPWSFANIERIVAMATEQIFLDMLRTQNQLHLKDRGLTITVMGVRDRTLIAPIFRFAPNDANAVTIQAREARLDFDLAHHQVILRMKRGYIDVPGKTRISFEQEDKAFPLPDRFQRLRPQRIRMREINAEMATATRNLAEFRDRRLLEAGFAMNTGDFTKLAETTRKTNKLNELIAIEDHRRLRTEMHNRYATSCSCFFFVLLGSPFAIWMARKDFLTSFLFCFLPILAVYYPVSMMTVNMAKSGQLDPTWCVWMSNATLLVAACSFLRKVTQN